MVQCQYVSGVWKPLATISYGQNLPAIAYQSINRIVVNDIGCLTCTSPGLFPRSRHFVVWHYFPAAFIRPLGLLNLCWLTRNLQWKKIPGHFILPIRLTYLWPQLLPAIRTLTGESVSSKCCPIRVSLVPPAVLPSCREMLWISAKRTCQCYNCKAKENTETGNGDNRRKVSTWLEYVVVHFLLSCYQAFSRPI